MSDRRFRRYGDRHEAEGMDGLVDRRLGKASARQVPRNVVEEMLGLVDRLACIGGVGIG